ncbi:hypothetical protein A1D31_39645 [Bradyrhizobium liaoningense]|nr:hypothetical protein A1D31_39645 [Bradyrhizobium liaoningense]
MAKKFRDVPWKRNLNKVPDDILDQIEKFEGDIFFVGAAKSVAPDEVANGPLMVLRIPDTVGEISEVLPTDGMGKYSHRNRHGWEVVRRDLPMITKTFTWETPNFGDASTYGTHTHYRDREVFQREYNEPRNYKIRARILRVNAKGERIVHFRVTAELSRRDPALRAELLMMLNLLQENCGVSGVISSETPVADYIKTVALDWEVFPPGSAAEMIERFTKSGGSPSVPRSKVEERVKLFAKLKPSAYR